ncbi:MAG: hypothetical protein JW891_05875 [Candidatus Lokiarchaeota archaeon]|nr:hypothetical protein [Candidatus Lokiarchaeota archaeon]
MADKKKVLLKWDDKKGAFDPIESIDGMHEGVFLELLDDEKKWKYFYIKGASLIARRIARRAATGIAKTGYVHPKTNVRMGIEFELDEEVSPFEDMPEDIQRSQRDWYDGHYKQY